MSRHESLRPFSKERGLSHKLSRRTLYSAKPELMAQFPFLLAPRKRNWPQAAAHLPDWIFFG